MGEINEKHDQCEQFTRINKQLEILSLRIESLTEQREIFQSKDENEARSARETLSNLLQETESFVDQLNDLHLSVQTLQSQVSSDASVQKISLLCYCKQEISTLADKLNHLNEELKISLEICDDAVEKTKVLDKAVADIEHLLKKNKWKKQSLSLNVSLEDLNHVHNLLCELRSKRLVTDEYFDRNSSILQRAEHLLVTDDPEDDDQAGQGKGLFLSCMPVMIVTSAIMVYSYCSPVTLFQKFCRFYNVQDN